MDNCLLIVRGTTEVYRFPFRQIVFIEALTNENWCRIHTTCHLKSPREGRGNAACKCTDIPLLLGQVWELILKQIDDKHAIFRCGRSLLINPEYVRIIDVSQRKLVLSDEEDAYELNPSREALIEVKSRFM